jgi:glycosyltransferase involved in cell wall biosynthesis
MYYRPHYSGLTIYTERLARALARRGHHVTVLTSRFNPSLPRTEVGDGVTIARPRVLMRISKGVIMPSLPLWAWRLIRQADVVNAHVPQPDAALIALLARLKQKPMVLTYHCDLELPRGVVNFLANQGSHLANHIAAGLSGQIVTNTLDFAEHSAFLQRYLPKVVAIPPPIELSSITAQDVAAFREKYQIQPEDKVIGVAARLATEKGVEFLVEALPEVLQAYPTARVIFAGQYLGVLGEEHYAARLAGPIQALGDHWKYLGILSPTEISAFYQLADVTILPSINNTESFGMVQVESMISGTPVVATDLPGVRQPVKTTGMGIIVPPRDSHSLAVALKQILDSPDDFMGDPEEIAQRFSSQEIAEQYEAVFSQAASHL